MDIATEELAHLETVGATITMLMDGAKGELKDAVQSNPVAQLGSGSKAAKEELIHAALLFPRFLVEVGGAPTVTNCQGVPWTSAYLNANAELAWPCRRTISRLKRQITRRSRTPPNGNQVPDHISSRMQVFFVPAGGVALGRLLQRCSRSGRSARLLHFQ